MIQEDPAATVVSVVVEWLTEDVNLEQFGHELFALVDQFGCRRLVVDLKTVKVITSSGLGKLITLHRKMHRHQGTVVFCTLQPPVEEVLQTSRLIKLLFYKMASQKCTNSCFAKYR